MDSFKEFLTWEKASKDTIDFKKVYVDIAEDVLAGLLLSQIIFWHLPNAKTGRNKLKVRRNGKTWLAKNRTDWWEEIRLSPKQYDTAIGKLVNKGIVEVENTMFNGKKTPHIYLCQERLIELLNHQLNPSSPKLFGILPNGGNRYYPIGKIGLAQSVIPLTEITTEITTETTKRNKGICRSRTNSSLSFPFLGFIERHNDTIEEGVIEAVNIYLEEYRRTQGKDHPRLKTDQWERVIENIVYCSEIQENLSVDEVEKMIDKHFITEYRDCDYNILHFISDDVYNNRFYEEVYGLA
mgnify:CR=1 FL=1